MGVIKLNRETLNEFIARQCKLAFEDGGRDIWKDGQPQSEEIKWAVDKYIEANFRGPKRAVLGE